jgi:ribosome-associated protein
MVKIDFYELAVKIAEIAGDKKALDTVILDVHKLTAITNYFVITAVQSMSQINAISTDIEKTFKEQNIRPLRMDGISSSSWRVIDYGGTVVHVMSPKIRDLYKLEKLWTNADIIDLKTKKNDYSKKTVKSKIYYKVEYSEI